MNSKMGTASLLQEILNSKEFVWFSPLFIITAHNKWMFLSYYEQFATLHLNVPVFQHWLKRWLIQTRCMFCGWLTSGAVNNFHLFQKINELAVTQRSNGTYKSFLLPLPSTRCHCSFLLTKGSCSPPSPPWPFSHVRICSNHKKVRAFIYLKLKELLVKPKLWAMILPSSHLSDHLYDILP